MIKENDNVNLYLTKDKQIEKLLLYAVIGIVSSLTFS